MGKDKKWARVKHIMGKYYYRPKFELPVSIKREQQVNKLLGYRVKQYEVFAGIGLNSVEHKERMEVFNYFYALGKTDDEIRIEWEKVQRERRKDWKPWGSDKPKRERKDNQNPTTGDINWGSGGSHRGKIRVPSKKRKNKWKNFLKLFPNYKQFLK